MKNGDYKKRIEELRRLLRYHSKLYYEKDEPEISDYEYDMMFRERRRPLREGASSRKNGFAYGRVLL